MFFKLIIYLYNLFDFNNKPNDTKIYKQNLRHKFINIGKNRSSYKYR